MVSGGTMASGADRTRDDTLRVARTGGVRRDVWALVVIAFGVVGALFLLRSSNPPAAAPAPDGPPAASPPAVTEDAAVAPSPEAGTTIPSAMPRSRGAKLRALRALG